MREESSPLHSAPESAGMMPVLQSPFDIRSRLA